MVTELGLSVKISIIITTLTQHTTYFVKTLEALAIFYMLIGPMFDPLMSVSKVSYNIGFVNKSFSECCLSTFKHIHQTIRRKEFLDCF